MTPKVKSVKPIDNYFLELIFEDDNQMLFDVNPYLEIGDFTELKDPEMFKTAHVFMGTIQWDNGLDIAPETLYAESRHLA